MASTLARQIATVSFYTIMTDRLISPEDRLAYQRELVRLMRTRNDSLSERMAERWVEKRKLAGASSGLDTVKNPTRLREEIARELYFAGLDIIESAKNLIY